MLRYLFLPISFLLLLTACGDGLTGQAGGKDHAPAKWERMVCESCDLANANLNGAILYKSDLTGANLKGANMAGANLYDVIGADFNGASNVPSKYLKD